MKCILKLMAIPVLALAVAHWFGMDKKSLRRLCGWLVA